MLFWAEKYLIKFRSGALFYNIIKKNSLNMFQQCHYNVYHFVSSSFLYNFYTNCMLKFIITSFIINKQVYSYFINHKNIYWLEITGCSSWLSSPSLWKPSWLFSLSLTVKARLSSAFAVITGIQTSAVLLRRDWTWGSAAITEDIIWSTSSSFAESLSNSAAIWS